MFEGNVILPSKFDETMYKRFQNTIYIVQKQVTEINCSLLMMINDIEKGIRVFLGFLKLNMSKIKELHHKVIRRAYGHDSLLSLNLNRFEG